MGFYEDDRIRHKNQKYNRKVDKQDSPLSTNSKDTNQSKKIISIAKQCGVDQLLLKQLTLSTKQFLDNVHKRSNKD